MTLDQAESYFEGGLDHFKRMCEDGTPWVFLCGAAMIEYLTKLTLGKGRKNYIKFVRSYMPGYDEFQYGSKEKDLPEQLYFVLRCGLVHGFSLFPDAEAQENGGRIRSVVLSHTDPHLSNRSDVLVPDGCVLNANHFVEDIRAALKRALAELRASPASKALAEQQLRSHPPVGAL